MATATATYAHANSDGYARDQSVGGGADGYDRYVHGVAGYVDCECFAAVYCGWAGASFDEVTWILTTYLVANAVVLPMSAWLIAGVWAEERITWLVLRCLRLLRFFVGLRRRWGSC